MGFRSSQQCIRRDESTDSKTMIPLIQNTVQKPVNGCLDRVAIRFVVVHMCDGGDDWQRDGCEVGSWQSLRVCEARDHGTKSCQLPRSLPPLDDLGKVCAKFNGRSRGYLVSTKKLQINSQPVDAKWPT